MRPGELNKEQWEQLASTKVEAVQLTKFSIVDIERFWPIIDWALRQAPPLGVEDDDAFVVNMQRMLLEGEVDAWGIASVPELKLVGLMTTRFAESLSGEERLFVTSLFVYSGLSDAAWMEVVAQLKEYAAVRGVKYIGAFTSNERIAKLAKDLGADVSWRVITLEV